MENTYSLKEFGLKFELNSLDFEVKKSDISKYENTEVFYHYLVIGKEIANSDDEHAEEQNRLYMSVNLAKAIMDCKTDKEIWDFLLTKAAVKYVEEDFHKYGLQLAERATTLTKSLKKALW